MKKHWLLFKMEQDQCFLYPSAGKPFQCLYLYLCPAQLTECFFRGVHFQMSVGSAQGGFQLSEICRAEKMIHLFSHRVTQVGSFRKSLPGRDNIAAADIPHSGVQIF